MSASRRKVKKQLKKQNRSEIVRSQPVMPRARRKGGQYIYPAGAYRNAMVQAQALTPAVIEVIQELPVIKPEITVEVRPEDVIETAAKWRKLIPAFSAVLILFALIIVNASGNSQRSLPAGVRPVLREAPVKEELNITEAEPMRELGVAIDLDSVKEEIEAWTKDTSGDWAVYLKDLNSDEELYVNDHQMPSASLIKLYVAGLYFEELEAGHLSASARTERDLSMMISWSDNNAWQDLETCIGGGNYIKGLQMVTDFASRHGYKDTGRLIGGASVYAANANNYTSIRDTGRVLCEIFEGTYVSENASEKILSLMSDQHITTKIPSGLPEGIRSANKTGELAGIENDAAIVYGRSTDYILVIMSNNNYAGTRPVAELSKLIYGLLNPGSAE